MSREYVSNHYVPQWYQRRFIPACQVDQELFLLDLRPEWFRDGRGVKRRHKALKRTGTRKCFAIDDLYTVRFEGDESREMEREFFGDVDARGKQAVELVDAFDHDRAITEVALRDLLTYMSTQKLRTPKGLDWLMHATGSHKRQDVLDHVERLQTIYGAIWAESAWQIADASKSATKFIVSDHPVTIYNVACPPGHPRAKGASDPDIRLLGSHTLLPLSAEKLLILTNVTWACNPRRAPLEMRPHPDLERGAMFNMLDVQTQRSLSETEVQTINWVIKKRAYRFVAAGREEWLHPERHIKVPWRSIGDSYLLMPDPRGLHPASEITVGYGDGSTTSMDSFGRRPWQPDFGVEVSDASEIQAHSRWCKEFEALFGTDRRGLDGETRLRMRT